MTVRMLLLWVILLPCLQAQAADLPRARPAPEHRERDSGEACEETEDCILDGLELDNEQQRQVHDILQMAAKKRDDLRDETINRIRDILTAEQVRQLEQRRTGLLADRARRLRQKARQLQLRARKLNETH